MWCKIGRVGMVPGETFERHTLKPKRNWAWPIKSSTIKKHVFPKTNTVSVSSWNNMFLPCVSTPLYWILLWHFSIGNLSSRNCWIGVTFPIFELRVHVLTFSFEKDQYTSLTNQKIVIYAGQSSGTAEILSQGLTCWYAS